MCTSCPVPNLHKSASDVFCNIRLTQYCKIEILLINHANILCSTVVTKY
jgi:hypothetical protein